ncbi:hypothetical protein Fot_28496 [Forsythia ovata]|uniref:Uncharacterized protein n=1 Tax=Forsythia ovata TaxID=205694 RepID=A0ABD1TP65_9LAMI
MPKLKIRRGGVVDDILHPPPVPSTASVPEVAIPKTPEAMVNSSSFIPLASEVTSGMPSVLRSGKRKAAADSKEESSMPGKGMDDVGDFRRTGQGREDPFSEVEDHTLQDREASQTPILPPTGKYEYINIGSRRDELDLMVLGKLPVLAAIAAASVHKYCTSTFGKAANNAELTELLKLVEMYTSRSHILNCELYKVLAMKVDELRSTVEGDEDVDTLCLENKDLWKQLAFSKDTRARAIYDITKAKMIQRACVQAQKKAESQLRSCQNMIHAKDKD